MPDAPRTPHPADAAAQAIVAQVTALRRLVAERENAIAERDKAITDLRVRLVRQTDQFTAELQQREAAADESAMSAAHAERALDVAQAEIARLRAALAEASRRGAPAPGATPERAAPARSTRPASPKQNATGTRIDASQRIDYETIQPAEPTEPRSGVLVPTVQDVPSAVPPTPVQTPSGGPPAESVTLASVFQAWCAEGRAVMSNVQFFAGHVAQTLPAAAVSAVYRDANSQAQPVTLARTSGVSPVEYWLVAAEGRHWLLPQPVSATQFRELWPCMDGSAAPATLAHVVPADVRVVADRVEIVTRGRVA